MRRNILWRFNVLLVVAFISKVKSLDTDNLKANYPIYGLASIANSNASQCFQELGEIKDAVDNSKVWGLKVLDSSGRPSIGFLYGNNLWIGSHKQCIDIQNRKAFELRLEKVNHTVTPYDFPPFELGFAMVVMKHNNDIQYHMRLPLDYVVQLGLCVPKSCSEREISKLSQEYLSNRSLEFQKEFGIDLQVTDIRMLKEDLFWILKLPKTLVLAAIFAVVLLLTGIGTILDMKKNNKGQNLIQGNNAFLNGKFDTSNVSLPTVQFIPSSGKHIVRKFFECFSIYSNTKSLIKMKSSAGGLPAVHGIKFLTMVWIIVAHTFFYQGDFTLNPPLAWRLVENFPAQVLSNCTFSVDTYLFLSGFLLAYVFFNKVNPHNDLERAEGFLTNTKKFLLLCIRRFLRFTPTYIIIILLCNVAYTFYDQESSLYVSERLHTICDQYWWRNILYINNFFPKSEMCLSWSWYMSIDLQFFTIGTFLLILSTAYFKVAVFLTFLILLIQISITAYTSYSIGYIPTLDDQLEHLDQLYYRPWIRIGPYIIGLITGYLLVIQLKNKMELGKITKFILWCLFPLLNLWLLFTLYTREVSLEFTTFYVGVARPLWGIGIGWLVVALFTGNAGYIYNFLSYKAFIPLGRLTLSAFLLNPLVIIALSLASESVVNLSINQAVLNATGAALTSFMIALVFSVIFESPFIGMTRLLFRNPTGNLSSSQERVNPDYNESTTSSKL